MSEIHSLTFTRTIHAAPAEVLRGFTHPTLLRDWLCDHASAEARLGGPIFLSWQQGYQVMGRYIHLDLPGGLSFTWLGSGDPGQTLVEVTAVPSGEETALRLVHTGLGEGPAWELQSSRWNNDWPEALENLQSVVETGVDLRIARRPRLGIYMDQVTPDVVSRLNLSAAEGVLIQNTLEGSGAQAAGLVKDDVLVSLNGVPLRTPNSFAQALHGLNAGDCPPIEFIRAGVKQSTTLTLGTFPIPEYPSAPAELAEKERAVQAGEMVALREQLAGLSEAEAGHHPKEGSWSVKEMVAHLALTDRDFQTWVANMLNDEPVADDLRMSPNVAPRIAALTARIPTLEGLLRELEITLEDSAAMIAALSPDFAVHRKHLYRRVAEWAIEAFPNHYAGEHKDQFQDAIDAAKAWSSGSPLQVL